MDTTTRDGLAFALTTVSGYAFMPIFTKFIYEYSTLQPFDVTGWRFLAGVPIMWLLLYGRQTIFPSTKIADAVTHWKFLLLGFLLAIGALCIAFGLSYLDASLYIVLLRTQPAMVILLSAVFLHEHIPTRGWLALVMVLIGVVMMRPEVFTLSVGRTEMLGIGIALFHAFVISLYNLGQQQFTRGVKSKAHASAWTMTGTLLTVFPVWLLFGGFHAPTNTAGTLNVAGLVVLCTVLPIFTMYEAVSRLGASRFSLLASVGPVLTLLLAFALLGERLVWLQVVGGVLILASVPVLELKTRPRWLPNPFARTPDHTTSQQKVT
jgi:drug/metabolite transporter (DMT)-like permease